MEGGLQRGSSGPGDNLQHRAAGPVSSHGYNEQSKEATGGMGRLKDSELLPRKRCSMDSTSGLGKVSSAQAPWFIPFYQRGMRLPQARWSLLYTVPQALGKHPGIPRPYCFSAPSQCPLCLQGQGRVHLTHYSPLLSVSHISAEEEVEVAQVAQVAQVAATC